MSSPRDFHIRPNHIFTTYLALSHIYYSHDDEGVILLACYGDLLSGDMRNITIETDFQTLNDLLSQTEQGSSEAIEALSISVAAATEEHPVIDLTQWGGVYFEDHIFCLLAVFEEDESGATVVPEDLSYILNGYIKRGNILPEFIGFHIPTDEQLLTRYYHQLLVMQYHLYLCFLKSYGKRPALVFSNLCDPIFFALAKHEYELTKKKH